MATLYLIAGMPGSGKTALSRQLAEENNAIRLEPDAWLVTLGTKPITEGLRQSVEELQLHIATDLLRLGVSVILENGFWLRSEREELRDRAHALGAHAQLHVMDVPMNVRWERIQQRNAISSIGVISLSQLESWEERWEFPDATERSRFDRAEIHR